MQACSCIDLNRVRNAGIRFVGCLSVLLLLMCAPHLNAQDSSASTPFVQFSGSVTVTADFYNSSATPGDAQPGRRPTSLYRIMFNPNLKIGDLISIPFNLRLTTPETNTLTPAISKPSLSDFFQNPANSFGFSSITPKIGWAEFLLGSHTPQYSSLSVGDQQIFGGGIDLKPGSFRIAASAGVAQRAVEPDTAKNIRGAYRRDMYVGRIAFGKEDAMQIGVNVVRAKDDPGSLKNSIASIIPERTIITATNDTLQPFDTMFVAADTVRLTAEEGFVVSSDIKMPIADGISVSGEVALSGFTRDQGSPEKVVEGNPFDAVQTTRTSSRADVAGNAEISLQQKSWGIKVKGLYMGAGFAPIGYPFVQSDKLEFTVSPNLKLFDDKLVLTGTIGERTNNLSKTKGETMTQLIGSANMSLDIGESFNISAQYSNFGIRNDQSDDSLKVQTVTQSFSIDPTLTLDQEAMMHTITVSFGMDTYDDFNVVTGAENSNDTRTALASYTVAFKSFPLMVNVLSSYMENKLPTGALIVRNIGSTLSYALFNKKVTPSLTVTASGSTLGSAATDSQILYKFSVGWNPHKLLNLKVEAGNNNFRYGNPLVRGSDFHETLIQLSATTQF